jgi:hypothetical protein
VKWHTEEVKSVPGLGTCTINIGCMYVQAYQAHTQGVRTPCYLITTILRNKPYHRHERAGPARD